MSTYRFHILGGAAAFGLLHLGAQHIVPGYLSHSWTVLAGFLAIAMLGSIFPDIDVKSNMQKIFIATMVIALPLAYAMQKYYVLAALIAISIGLVIIRHRGLTHRAWFLIAFPLLFGCYLSHRYPADTELIYSACLFFSAGGLSHLVMDFGISRFFRKKRP